MKRLVLLVVLCAACFICGAQTAIPDNISDDIIKGVGFSIDQETAERNALLSLSSALYSNIKSSSTYTVENDGTNRSEKYSKSVSLKTAMQISCIPKEVETTPDGFKVTCWFNKKEYAIKLFCEYENRLMEAYEYENSDEPHSVNRRLGSLYLAYVAVSDTLLNLLFNESIIYRDDALEKIRGILERTGGYMLSARERDKDEKSIDRWWKVRDETCNEPMLPLPGFEYIDRYGKWAVPNIFYDNKGKRYIGTDMNGRIWAEIYTRGKKYRLTFEKAVGNTYVRINVPEWFYALVDPVGRCEKTFI